MLGRSADHSSRLARGELADSEQAERLRADAPDRYLRRREFLLRTAALAGSAGLASLLPADELLAVAANRAAASLPSPREMPIDTFVVLMMENRSFDHYLGWHPDADGKNDGLTYPDLEGERRFETHHLTPDFQGCGFRDPDHGWDGGRHQYNGGRVDGFYTGNAQGTGSDEFALGYYERDDLGFVPHVADTYTLYDRYFCSIMASTYPNKHYQLGAQNGGQKGNLLPVLDEPNLGFEWETILDRARSRGVSVGYYVSDLPFPALYGVRGLTWVRPVVQFYLDAALGTLPNICFVDPPYRDGGGFDGMSADEHPHGDLRLGQAFMSDIAHAFIDSRQYRRGALFINYDEWGGFFEHVKPRFVRDDREDRDLAENWGFTGFRVPAVAVSPYSRDGGVSHMLATHESILKLISYRFGLGHLNTRHRHATNIGRSFDFNAPDFEPPSLPSPKKILSTPCALGGETALPLPLGGRRLQRPEPHHLVRLETSGLLDRLGYEVAEPTLDAIFRYPDTVRQALRDARAQELDLAGLDLEALERLGLDGLGDLDLGRLGLDRLGRR